MSTRAYIGIKNNDETVTAIYNQSDGGLENLGHVLKTYFKTEENVRELLTFGYVSSIQDLETYEDLKKNGYSFDESEWKDLQGVPGVKIHIMPGGNSKEQLNNIEEVMGSMIAYAYLYEPKENMWYYTKGKGLKPLSKKKGLNEKIVDAEKRTGETTKNGMQQENDREQR